MALLYKCDRCRKILEHKDGRPISEIITRIVINPTYTVFDSLDKETKNYDLCKECTRYLNDWLKN